MFPPFSACLLRFPSPNLKKIQALVNFHRFLILLLGCIAERILGGVWGIFLEDFGRGLEDFERDLEVKTGGSNPKTSKTRISLFNWKFPYSLFLAPSRFVYTVFSRDL